MKDCFYANVEIFKWKINYYIFLSLKAEGIGEVVQQGSLWKCLSICKCHVIHASLKHFCSLRTLRTQCFHLPFVFCEEESWSGSLPPSHSIMMCSQLWLNSVGLGMTVLQLHALPQSFLHALQLIHVICQFYCHNCMIFFWAALN